MLSLATYRDDSDPIEVELDPRGVIWLDAGRHMCCLLAANDEMPFDEVAHPACELEVYDGALLETGEGAC